MFLASMVCESIPEKIQQHALKSVRSGPDCCESGLTASVEGESGHWSLDL